jgi:hypothetical protein
LGTLIERGGIQGDGGGAANIRAALSFNCCSCTFSNAISSLNFLKRDPNFASSLSLYVSRVLISSGELSSILSIRRHASPSPPGSIH